MKINQNFSRFSRYQVLPGSVNLEALPPPI